LLIAGHKESIAVYCSLLSQAPLNRTLAKIAVDKKERSEKASSTVVVFKSTQGRLLIPAQITKAPFTLRQGSLKSQRHFYGQAYLPNRNPSQKRSSSNRRNLKTPALRLSVDGKHFENGAFPKR